MPLCPNPRACLSISAQRLQIRLSWPLKRLSDTKTGFSDPKSGIFYPRPIKEPTTKIKINQPPTNNLTHLKPTNHPPYHLTHLKHHHCVSKPTDHPPTTLQGYWKKEWKNMEFLLNRMANWQKRNSGGKVGRIYKQMHAQMYKWTNISKITPIFRGYPLFFRVVDLNEHNKDSSIIIRYFK